MSFEMLANFRMEDGEEALKLIHFDFENLKLIYEYFLEPNLHQVLEDAICVLFIHCLNVHVSCQIVHALTVGNVRVEVGVDAQKGMQNGWI